MSFIPKSKAVNVRHFSNPKDYLTAVIKQKFEAEVEPEKLAKLKPQSDTLPGDIFSQVQKMYNRDLMDNFKQRIDEGVVDDYFASDDFEQDVDEMNQKNAIHDKKRDLEKQIFNLRMKHNAMLK